MGYERVRCLPPQNISIGLIQAFLFMFWEKQLLKSGLRHLIFHLKPCSSLRAPAVLQKFCSLTSCTLMLLLLFPFLISLLLLITKLPRLSPLPHFSFHFSFWILPPSHILNLSYLTPITSHQARMELRRLKQEVLNKHAVTVIWAYWQGTKVFPTKPHSSVSVSQLSCHPCIQCPIPSHSRCEPA